MKLQLRKDNLAKDIFAGVIVALVSIPISMGYAQVAGLPAMISSACTWLSSDVTVT